MTALKPLVALSGLALLLVLVGGGTWARAESAPRVELVPSASSVAPGSEIEVRVLVSSDAPLNAFRVALDYPFEMLEFRRASAARSFASVWEPGTPRIERGGVVRLAGGAAPPFSGEDQELITLVFGAKAEGTGAFLVRSAEFYLADGKGTKSEGTGGWREVAVRAGAPGGRVPTGGEEPRIANVSITRDPLTGTTLVFAQPEDVGAVGEMRMRTRSWVTWGAWRPAVLPEAVPSGAWAIQLKAIGNEGGEAVVTFNRSGAAAGKALLSLFGVAAAAWLSLRAKRRLLGSVALVLFLAGVPGGSRAATLSLGPPAGTFTVGGTFEVQVLLDSEGEPINVLDIVLQFPPEKLQAVSPSIGQSVIEAWTRQPSVDNARGVIRLQGGIPGGITTSGSVIASITFRARQTGVALVRFADGSRVLKHDGLGTDALRDTRNGLYAFVLPPPARPIVVSSSHPDPDKWYAAGDAVFIWTDRDDAAAEGYSYVVDGEPLTLPDNIYEGARRSVRYGGLPSGTNYFHIKALRRGVWGGVTHVAINIDTDPPASFPIRVVPANRTTNKTLFVEFKTTDRHSGLDRYEYAIIPLSPGGEAQQAGEDAGPLFVETAGDLRELRLELGTYDVVMRAYDRAGNIREEVTRVSVVTPLVFYATHPLTLALLALLLALAGYAAWHVWRWHQRLDRARSERRPPEAVKAQIEELKRYRGKYGALVLLLALGALLLTARPVAAEETLPPPNITTVSQAITNEEIFYVGGRIGMKDAEVLLYVQNLGTGEASSYAVTPNGRGEWLYRHHTFLAAGRYALGAQTKLGDAVSPPSPQIELAVEQTAFRFGATRVSRETLYLALAIALFALAVGLTAATASLAVRGRRKHRALEKEIREAEEAVRRGFAVLRRDIEAELKTVRSGGARAGKAEQKEQQLLEDLARIEELIGKEVLDIEQSEEGSAGRAA